MTKHRISKINVSVHGDGYTQYQVVYKDGVTTEEIRRSMKEINDLILSYR